MFRVPIWRMSEYSATMSTWDRVHHLGDDRHARPLARLREVAEALDAEALEAVRARARLERAAADDRRAVRATKSTVSMSWSRLSTEHGPAMTVSVPSPTDRVEDPDDRVLGVELARHELVGLRDRR